MSKKPKKRGVDLIDLADVPSPKPGLVTCYGSGRPFTKKKGTTFRVQHGRNRLVSRVLCVVQYFGKKCERCPQQDVTITFMAKERTDGP